MKQPSRVLGLLSLLTEDSHEGGELGWEEGEGRVCFWGVLVTIRVLERRAQWAAMMSVLTFLAQ